VTPPRVRWSSFQSASRYSPCSLVEDGRVLLCHELADIVSIFQKMLVNRTKACEVSQTTSKISAEYTLTGAQNVINCNTVK